MNYKIEGAIRRNRKKFIICAILWVILTIVFVVPFSYSIFESSKFESFDITLLIENLGNNFSHPFKSMGGLIKNGGMSNFTSIWMWFSIFYVIFFIIGFVKSAPKHEYTDIEHGSSDWSEHGEQYRILNRNKGIILAENNYLPVDKRGNVNVLVVGRFWCW